MFKNLREIFKNLNIFSGKWETNNWIKFQIGLRATSQFIFWSIILNQNDLRLGVFTIKTLVLNKKPTKLDWGKNLFFICQYKNGDHFKSLIFKWSYISSPFLEWPTRKVYHLEIGLSDRAFLSELASLHGRKWCYRLSLWKVAWFQLAILLKLRNHPTLHEAETITKKFYRALL